MRDQDVKRYTISIVMKPPNHHGGIGEDKPIPELAIHEHSRGKWVVAEDYDVQIADMAWLITHYEIVYDPGVATKEDKERADRIFKRCCEIVEERQP